LSEIVTVQITDLSRAGSGVARLESGEVVFTPFTAPGDEARVEIIERKKNYLHARLVELVKPSPDRVTPPCPVFGICGGCSWQHLPYELQFETKRKGLLHALKRSGIEAENTPLDLLPAKNDYGYRNRIQLRGNVTTQEIGFYARGSQKLVAIDHCPITDKRINDRLPALREEGFKQFKEDFKLEIAVDESGEVGHAWNQGHAALGFRQVNDEQNEALKDWVATHTGDARILLDLYGGAGNLSRPMKDRFKSIHCVDISVPKTSPVPHLKFHRSGVGEWISRYRPETGSHSVILDPPREGLSNDFARLAKALDPLELNTLILVGCDVDAFVRDCHRLLKAGYQIQRLGVLDLFPQTPHVESLALFTR
jgi:23S rRNA (uracil1939-C5)-methyltransferase